MFIELCHWIQIDLIFLLINFLLVNNRRVLFMMLDTLINSMLFDFESNNNAMYLSLIDQKHIHQIKHSHQIGLGIIHQNQVAKQVPIRYIGEEQTDPGGQPQKFKFSLVKVHLFSG